MLGSDEARGCCLEHENAEKWGNSCGECPDHESGDGDLYAGMFYGYFKETPGIVYRTTAVVRSKTKRAIKEGKY